jgi:predicted lipoprotein with Yx(FWY)xxD motif
MGAILRTCTLLALSLVLAACGAEDPDAGASDEAQDAAAAAEDTAAQATDVDLAVASSDLGEILVDGQGMTLYLFTEDRAGHSVCEDDCAAAWPPLLVQDEPVPGDGIDAALLGETERSDGTTQLTYAGWPLYTWAQDQQPGDVTGQGVQEVWFVVSPEGDAVTEAVEEDRSRGDGY